jgi:hypothetical protein
MIDIKPRQIEQTRHPRDDRDDVQGLHPGIDIRHVRPLLSSSEGTIIERIPLLNTLWTSGYPGFSTKLAPASLLWKAIEKLLTEPPRPS